MRKTTRIDVPTFHANILVYMAQKLIKYINLKHKFVHSWNDKVSAGNWSKIGSNNVIQN